MSIVKKTYTSSTNWLKDNDFVTITGQVTLAMCNGKSKNGVAPSGLAISEVALDPMDAESFATNFEGFLFNDTVLTPLTGDNAVDPSLETIPVVASLLVHGDVIWSRIAKINGWDDTARGDVTKALAKKGIFVYDDNEFDSASV